MRNKPMVIVICCVACVVAGSVTAAALGARPAGKGPISSSAAYAWGRNIKSALSDKKADDVVAVVDGIAVKKREVDTVVANNKAGTLKKTYNDALTYVIRQDALYARALKEGFTMSDAELDAVMDDTQKMFDSADNKDAFEQYLRAAGMTEQQYFDSRREESRREWTIEKWLEHVKSTDCAKLDGTAWNSYRTKLEDGVVKAARVTFPS